MSQKVGTVLIDVAADTSKLVQGMNMAEKKIQSTVNNIKTTVISMASAYVGISGVKAFGSMIQDTADVADETDKLAHRLGLATEELSKYQYAAIFAGVSNGELTAGLSAMIRRLKNFQRDGGGAAADGFKTLGITADFARENMGSTDEAFIEILKRLEQMPEGYRKTAVAQDIFSKSASNVLHLTASDIKSLGIEAERTGMLITSSSAAMAASYNDNLDKISTRIEGAKRQFSLAMLPGFNANSEGMLALVESLSESMHALQQDSEFMEEFSGNVTSMGISTVNSLGFMARGFVGASSVISTTVTGWEDIVMSFETYFNRVGYAIDYWSARANGNAEGMEAALKGYNGEAEKWRDGLAENDAELQSFLETNQKLIDGINAATGAFEKNVKAAKTAKDGGIQPALPSSGSGYTEAPTPSSALQLDENTLNIIKQYEAALGLITPEADKLNETYLAMYNVVQNIFDDDKLNAFFGVWSDKLDEIAEKNAGLSDQLKSDLASYGVTSKDWTAGLEGTAKMMANIGNSVADIGTDMRAYNKLQADILKSTATEAQKKSAMADLDSKHNEAQLSAYSNMAGAVGNIFEEGTSGAKAMLVVQTALSVAAGLTAIANAMAAGDGYTAVARGLAVAATLTSFGLRLSGSGSGAGGMTQQEEFTMSKQDIEASYEPITSRLDRQIDLLEAIGRVGTASIVDMQIARAEYQQSQEEILGYAYVMAGDTSVYGGDILRDIFRTGDITTSVGGLSATDIYGSFGSLLEALGNPEALMSNISSWFAVSTPTTLDTYTQQLYSQNEYTTMLDMAREALKNFSLAVSDTIGKFSDMSLTFQDLYDNMTGTTTYEDKRLAVAQAEVEALLNGEDLASYLAKQIDNIAALEAAYGGNIQDLLLSENPADLSAQGAAVKELESLVNTVFDNGAEDALNFIDSIKLVGESMVSTTDQITNGLQLFDDLYLGQYSPLSMLEQTAYANNIAYTSSLTGGTNVLDDKYQALVTAATSATRAEDFTFARIAYEQQLNLVTPDATRTDIVNEIIAMRNEISDLKDEVKAYKDEQAIA